MLRDEEYDARGDLEVLALCALAQCHCHLHAWERALTCALICVERSSLWDHLVHPLVWHVIEPAVVA
eukprot:3655288-Prymnesium_polylepis.1